MTRSRKIRVFLCHALQDEPVVRELYQRLLAEGWIEPWLEEEKILPGQDRELETEKAVESADAVLVCLSASSVTEEGNIQHEIRIILDMADYKPEDTIFVIPLRLNDCTVPRRLKKWQHVDYYPPEKRRGAYQQLLKSMRSRAQSLGVEKQPKTTQVEGTMDQKAETVPDKPPPKEVKTVKEILAGLPAYKLQEPVCEACHKPFKVLEQTAVCSSCGAKYHRLCGVRLGYLKYTCLRCGKQIDAKEFRLPAV